MEWWGLLYLSETCLMFGMSRGASAAVNAWYSAKSPCDRMSLDCSCSTSSDERAPRSAADATKHAPASPKRFCRRSSSLSRTPPVPSAFTSVATADAVKWFARRSRRASSGEHFLASAAERWLSPRSWMRFHPRSSARSRGHAPRARSRASCLAPTAPIESPRISSTLRKRLRSMVKTFGSSFFFFFFGFLFEGAPTSETSPSDFSHAPSPASKPRAGSQPGRRRTVRCESVSRGASASSAAAAEMPAMMPARRMTTRVCCVMASSSASRAATASLRARTRPSARALTASAPASTPRCVSIFAKASMARRASTSQPSKSFMRCCVLPSSRFRLRVVRRRRRASSDCTLATNSLAEAMRSRRASS
mmetsp:Transcript_34431/g.118688  ORF Transcript_34431/g.118688 Transcript_34431/m.118688 type:complete len:364 (+) Transcript_34431:101-1192(+)